MENIRKSMLCLVLVGVVAFLAGSATQSLAYVSSVEEYVKDKFEFHGYLAQRFSLQLGNVPETSENDIWDLSMMRSTLYTDVSYTPFKWLRLVTVFELSLEYQTTYLKRLNRLPTSTFDIMDELNRWDFREFYGDFTFGKRVQLRLGRQQVVWGKTDFFRGLDLIHGFDYTWRSFLEVENEYLRIPLIMANMVIQVPELNGSLQGLVRPGWDRDNWIGNRYDLYGGRWASQPGKGFNFLDANGVPYNLDHSEGDQSDPTFGVRWSGSLLGVEYTLNYLRTFNEDPVVNSIFNPWKSTPPLAGGLGEFIYPIIDLAGVTLTYYVPWVDVVARTEVVYTWDKPYNVGQNFLGGALPGFNGIMEKDTVRIMVALDYVAGFTKTIFRSERPGFLNIQVFDTWVVDHSEADDLVNLAGFGHKLPEHSTIITAILAWNYMHDRINPTLAAGIDPRDGSGFFIPSLAFVYGDHWRFRIEYDMFFNNKGKLPGEVENQARVFQFFDNNDQLYFRIMYQF